MSLISFFSPPVNITIKIDDADQRGKMEIRRENGKTDQLLLFIGNDTVKGKVDVTFTDGNEVKPIEYKGIKIELIGQVEFFYDRGNHFVFTSMVQEFARNGTLTQNSTYDFEFLKAEKLYDSYVGTHVNLRYFLRFSILRPGISANIIKELDFWVHVFSPVPAVNNSIKTEVGVEDNLHLEFEFNKSKYHLKEVVIGKIYFILVRINIKSMEMCLIRRESSGTGVNLYNENEVITKYEVMDGCPAKGQSVPIRFFLGAFPVTPSFKGEHNKFSVKYFINLVILDEDDRKYFKQQEVTLYRKKAKKSKSNTVTTDEPQETAVVQDTETVQEQQPDNTQV